MTERDVWLKIAEMFDSAEPTWEGKGYYHRIVGICQATRKLADRRIISHQMANRLNDRLGFYFNPNGKDADYDFFWPEDRRRTSRTARATACCFLAAIVEEGV